MQPSPPDMDRSSLPSGTVTFLFTDVESSTRLLQAHPRAYAAAIARHHELLAAAVERAGGVVFETVGDAVYAAFSDPVAAVRSAIDGQRALQAEPWPEIGTLRVRMGLHSGPVEVRGAHYFGAPLYRCARVMSAAHGGQVVLSRATAELVRDNDVEIRLRDLGEHRLKDLQRPEQLHQLLHPDLPAEFPPLRSLEGRPNNLPTLRSETVGRARELADLRTLALRSDVQLVTLVGPGGIGKTRLALAAGAEMLEDFPDGVFAVPLGALIDPGIFVPTLARALGLSEVPGHDLRATLAEHLRQRRLLLILDNFEHLLAAAADLGTLLAAAPRLKAMVTSRSPLRLYGEREFAVPPLGLHAADGDPPAVQLFIERAREIRADFVANADEATTIASICAQLDGLPLAIELAATRIRSLEPAELLARLHQRLALLTGGARDLPERQRTLRGTILWSYDLLTHDEQALFRRFATFAGGAALEDAEVMLAGKDDDPAVLDGLESLVAQSLLRRDTTGRFSMLGAIREFALERQRDVGEEAPARAAHARHYARVAQAADAKIRGPEQLGALARLDRDEDNIRAALEWALGPAGDLSIGRDLAAAMTTFWSVRARFTEAPRWLAEAFGRPGPDDAQRVWALTFSTFFLTESGHADDARVAAEEAVAVARRIKHPALESVASANLATMLARDRGVPLAEDAVALARSTNDAWTLAFVLVVRGELARAAGDDELALALNLESVDLGLRTGDRSVIALALGNAAVLQLKRGDTAAAARGLSAAIMHERELGDPWALAYGLIGLGGVAAHQGDGAGAATILGAADAWFSSMRVVVQVNERVEFDRHIARARSLLSPDSFTAAWTAGAAMPLEDALGYASKRVGNPPD